MKWRVLQASRGKDLFGIPVEKVLVTFVLASDEVGDEARRLTIRVTEGDVLERLLEETFRSHGVIDDAVLAYLGGDSVIG